MNIKDPIGLEVEFAHPYFPEHLRKGSIIGVVKDFHLRPLREKVVPFVMRMYRPWYNYILIKYNTENTQELINFLEGIAKKHAPDYQFSYSFFDQEVKDLYIVEYKAARIISYFTFLSIIISCMGLLGSTIHELEQKTKQIGIRKVFGGSIQNLILFFCFSFTISILISFIFASILAKIAIDKILQQYAYRTEITIWLFLGAFAIALFLALSTIIYQTYKSSVKNPVESLRYE
jgi:putative ABC transport system permease protein